LAAASDGTFKLSTAPLFIDKVRDVVGLSLNPPDQAIVLCVDEKSQGQRWTALNRCCQWAPAPPQRQTPDDARHGTTSLFAALTVATGQVLANVINRIGIKSF
jgi:hypothetical protein